MDQNLAEGRELPWSLLVKDMLKSKDSDAYGLNRVTVSRKARAS
jgi:hypothetical protein